MEAIKNKIRETQKELEIALDRLSSPDSTDADKQKVKELATLLTQYADALIK